MANIEGFDADQVEPNKGFDPLPAGDYQACIVKSEDKKTNNGNGSYISLELEVIDGECKGRRLWANLNLDNPNAEAVRIARGDLSAICRACGIPRPKDTSELHNIPMVLKVGLKPRKDTGEIQNVIKGYSPVAGGTVATKTPGPTQTQTQTTQPQQANSNTPPWKR